MTQIHIIDENGRSVPVSASNPIPIAGGAGDGMTPEDVTATAPLSWDAGTATMSVDLSSKADVNHTHPAGDISGLSAVATSGSYGDLSGSPVAAYVDPETGTLADVVNSLIAAGLMAGS